MKAPGELFCEQTDAILKIKSILHKFFLLYHVRFPSCFSLMQSHVLASMFAGDDKYSPRDDSTGLPHQFEVYLI